MIFRGQLQRIHDYMFHIAVAIVIFISGFIIAYSNLPKPSFEFSTFVEQQEKFKQCVNNEALFLSAKGFENSYATLSLESIQNQFKALRDQIPSDCGSFHVESSYEQLEEMALPVLAKAQRFYGSKEVKAVNAVYTTPSQYNALLEQPQPYLFFISDKHQERIVAMKVTPTKESLHITPLWEYEQSQDLAYTQGEVQKLLLVYNEIKS
ncbi:hypothetical protein [Aliivibrio fischeri]|uniref:hypothetical protein n=1 Tax=Aliivibrio fischeri TaxID=668 RepID=UPI00084C2741|nr:hypothetical protein [Aliivibrio fischeri]OED51438.1 hypothetical protein BEI46_04380 [Aliivibrio fischeri]